MISIQSQKSTTTNLHGYWHQASGIKHHVTESSTSRNILENEGLVVSHTPVQFIPNHIRTQDFTLFKFSPGATK